MTKKHNERFTASRTCEEYEERARIKSAAELLEVVILPNNPKGQSSLRGLFAKN